MDHLGAALPPARVRQGGRHRPRSPGRGPATLAHRLSNARVEAMNTRVRLIIRRAFGFHSADALITLALLSFGGLCPPLPRQLS
jgi:hypothetical protein